MIIERVLLLIAAVAAIAAAAAITLFALAFAIYALLTPYLTQAGAAGAVALLFALSLLIAGLIMAARARGPKRDAVSDRESLGLVAHLMDLVKDKPFAAAGIAAAVGLVAMRNPRMIGAVLSAFLQGWQAAPNNPNKKR